MSEAVSSEMKAIVMKVPLYSAAGTLVEHIQLDGAELGGTVHAGLLRQALLAHEANRRAGTAKAKSRGETSHSGAKPWRQKHTGRSRAGSRNSPIWVGGGVAHGPRPRDYCQKLNKKMRRKALLSALLAKVQDGQLKLLQEIKLPAPKTKEMARLLKDLGAVRRFLIVLPGHDAVLWRCVRNIPGAAMSSVADLNAHQVLRARDVIFTRQAWELMLARAAPQGRAERPREDAARAPEGAQ